MDLASFAFVAISLLARAPAVDMATEHDRLRLMADDVAIAVELRGSPFEGEAGMEAAALALVSIAAGESAFRAEVADCRIVGSDHPSVSSWQLLGHWAMAGERPRDVCGNPTMAAYLALGVLERHAGRCEHCTLGQLFHAYASGDAGAPSDAGRRHCNRFVTLATRMGLAGLSCDAPPGPVVWSRGRTPATCTTRS